MKETVEKLSRKYDDRTEEEKSLSHAISLKKLIPLHFSEIEGKDGNV